MSWIKYSLYFILVIVLFGCSQGKTLFKLIPPYDSGIGFRNQITETDSFNMYEFMNIYTGGGVGIGDINNDGLEDVLFTGNQVSSKLYLNKGNLRFEDITTSAGLSTDRWCTGVALVDINTDGWLDIYVNVSGIQNTQNLLFINQGDLTFVESASNYGLADASQSMQSSFFDYDKDGDLDMYMIVNPVDYSLGNVNTVGPRKVNGESSSTDKLYRNNGDNTFTDVSREAGILVEGYGLGLTTMDIDNDGWQDIYVSNDFLTNDLLYINNQDGTFTERSHDLLDHTSFAGMGHDIADVNDDGEMDIFVADMLPEGNYRKKLLIPASSYDKFHLTQKMDYLPQYTRNTLQINNGNGSFSEVGQMAGIDQTDWSWASLFADYDLDGDKDLFITNGFLRDVGNLDYINYQKSNNSPFGSKSSNQEKRLGTLLDLGEAKISNYIYENRGGWLFENKTKKWGLNLPTCSNGAAFADLDNDGDLDLLVNNVNDDAHLYENNAKGHYLKIKLKGPSSNPNALGAKIKLYQNGQAQHHQHQPTRGYASSISNIVHFGLKENIEIDSLIIIWPNLEQSIFTDQPKDTLIQIDYNKETRTNWLGLKHSGNPKKLNSYITKTEDSFKFINTNDLFITSDFLTQQLLPRSHENIGSGICIADINNDGLEDVYSHGRIWYQSVDGSYHSQSIFNASALIPTGALLLDMDGDGDLDLYQGFGGTSSLIQDQIWKNEDGQFNLLDGVLPTLPSSTSTVSAADYDNDGDLDLFIGSRVTPGQYPKAPSSFLLKNQSTSGLIKFALDIDNQGFIPTDLGMVCSSIWTDHDNDGDQDLIVVGEWTGIQILTNDKGILTLTTVPKSNGWWNSITGTDIDNDGDTDYIIGNTGDNHPYNIDNQHPLKLYDSDFDNNEANDPILVQYNQDDYYIVVPRDKLIQQITAIRQRFPSYTEYAKAPFDKSFTKEEIDKATEYHADILSSIVLINNGLGNFEIKKLPAEAQRGPIYGISTIDLNDDGWQDLVVIGNSNDMEVSQGYQDALDGYYLINDQSGNFIPAPLAHSFNDNKDGKSMVRIIDNFGQLKLLVGSTSSSLESFIIDNNNQWQKVDTDVISVIHHFPDGSKQKIEIYQGEGYLTQNSKYICIPNGSIRMESIHAHESTTKEIK